LDEVLGGRVKGLAWAFPNGTNSIMSDCLGVFYNALMYKKVSTFALPELCLNWVAKWKVECGHYHKKRLIFELHLYLIYNGFF